MNRNTPTIIRRVVTRGTVAALAAALLGGCMSVPALSGPAPQTPGTPQKTITQLLTQWADLTNAAIAATGDTQNWYRGPIIEKKPWDPAAEDVGLAPCGTVGSKGAHQVEAGVQHESFEHDPHPIADKLTAYWEGEGFTVTRTIDWTDPTGGQSVLLRAERADGVSYGLDASTDLVAIDVSTECSTHPSIQAWAEERLQKRFDELHATPTPTPTPSADLGEGAADTGNPAAAAATTDPSDLFREFHENAAPPDSTDRFRELHDDASDHPAPTAASDPTDLFREVHNDTDKDSPPPTTKRTANDDNWTW